jgi:type II secretory pathway pseudopilin PulG
MTLDDIIHKDEDRVFAVDPECFIIFTGEVLSDTRPFIRVGNWIDLPAELIPLIENIIITDTMAGNPAHEQFNIDIKYLPVNRYIGSHSIVRRYLDYQKVFGLDLHNASVVDAERDIPDISTSSAVSDRESFMGIFYNDGNFRIVHNKKKIFDLRESCDSPLTAQAIHEKIAGSIKNQKRYSGCGMALIEGNPLYYRASAFASYLFPLRYYTKFRDLGINPRSLQAIIHPSENFLSLARFLKWKHTSASKIVLYSDSKEETGLQKALFSKARIDLRPFSRMKTEVIPGLSIEQKHHSFSIAASHDTATGTIRTAFIKGPSALGHLKKERYDALFVPYSVFEDAVSSLKTSSSPVVVLDDGNPSVAKIPRADYTILRQNVQYEFIRASNDADALAIIRDLVPDDIADAVLRNDADAMKKILADLSVNSSGYSDETALNTAALASLLISITTDRKFSALLRTFVRELYLFDAAVAPHRQPGTYRFDLIFTSKGVFETARRIGSGSEETLFCPDELRDEDAADAPRENRALCTRILEDRKRLGQLLSLYHNEPSSTKDLDALRIEIQKRKDAFHQERKSHPEKGKAFISGLRSSVEKVQRKEPGREHPFALHRHLAAIRHAVTRHKTAASAAKDAAPSQTAKKPLRRTKGSGRSLRHIFISGGVIIALLLSAVGIVMLFHSTAVQKKLATEQIRVQNAVSERARLRAKYNITVEDTDIYQFANKTAQKNGYAPIPVKDFKKRNPHWIFPGNVFILADGEEIKVKDGDTLWQISRTKLERLYIDFYVVIDAIDKDIRAGRKPDPAAVRTAQSLAITAAQKKLAAGFYGNQ